MTKNTDITLKNTIERTVTKILTLSASSSFTFPTISPLFRLGYKEACKRCPFALQNMPFYTSKDALLHGKRAPFRTQKGID